MADEDNQHNDRGRGKRGDSTGRNSITLGPKDKLVGSLTFDGDLTVTGHAEGEIHASGDVAVEGPATVKATIEGNNVTVQGNVTGSVHARGRLSLSGSGTLHGDVRVSKLTVEDGATLNGNVSMGPSVGGARGPETRAEGDHGKAARAEAPAQAEPQAVG
ncbi:MAG: polymer-forming cytoskeletal protein [Candidatus Dormibacteraeota bacterium]|nr:polymer-forming cytoskeletal protein [Candidatus Dormibacteraeota bacterium]